MITTFKTKTINFSEEQIKLLKRVLIMYTHFIKDNEQYVKSHQSDMKGLTHLTDLIDIVPWNEGR